MNETKAVQDAILQLGYEPFALEVKFDSNAKRDVETGRFWKMFVGSATFAIPLVIISMAPMLSSGVMTTMMDWMPMERWNWVMLALAVPVQFYFGGRFLRLGAKSLFSTSPDMNALILLGTLAAFLYSVVVTVIPHWIPEQSRHVYFEASAVVITLVLLEKYLETKSRHQASDAMKLLLNLVPKMATVIRNGESKSISVEEVVRDDVLEVRPGSAIAVDGIVFNGSTYIDESMVTGESVPVAKTAGDQVVAGTINGNGSIQFRSTEAIESLREVDIVAFDKTGTLTVGKPTLSTFHVLPPFQASTLLAKLAIVEARLSNGDQVFVGSEKYLNEQNMETSVVSHQVDEAIKMGSGYFFAAINRQLAALIVVSDPLKPSTPAAVSRLIKSDFDVALISGDNIRTGRSNDSN